MTDDDRDLDEARVAAYLTERFGTGPVEVASLRRNVGGMSRETWFAEVLRVQAGEQHRESLTFRLDHPEGSVVPVSLEREYKTFRALGASPVPVAETLWYEDDPQLLGRAPFYVRRTVPGSASAGQLFASGNEERRRKIGVDLAEKLAAVHTMDWRAAGLAEFMQVPERAEDHALLELEHYERSYRAAQPEPMPVVEVLFSWLKRNVPHDVQRTSLVWGDVGVGNFIYAGEEVVALTDWEQAHLGDPMKDWASALWRGVDALAPRDMLFEAYERASGLRIDEDRIRYYSVFIDAEYVGTSFPLLSELGPDHTRDATFVRLGIGVPYMCMEHGLRTIGY
ncbi:MAG: phosphotransferase family protein [Actinomycetota bacterium]|jgi:aminoglycoside phosphotransferase (APT) family kinase protein|nr:phosphotransferase family protein [Actinomycetota bacterium]